MLADGLAKFNFKTGIVLSFALVAAMSVGVLSLLEVSNAGAADDFNAASEALRTAVADKAKLNPIDFFDFFIWIRD